MPKVKLYEDLPKLPEKTADEKAYARQLLEVLYKHYPNPHCALNFRDPFELLCATILSAQCTDVRVNKTTPALFEAYPTPEAMAQAPKHEIEELIRSTGFYRNKAKALKKSSQAIVEKHNGEVPRKMDDLLEFYGVARKTANVVLGNAFGINMGVVVDTHVRRLSNRFGLTKHKKNTKKIERDLMALFPREEWTNLSHLMIHHGRNACKARISEPPDHPICVNFGKNCECREMRK
ncbi:MAG TPA: endonuclease III [Balneolaceae bacterium]|nr:endonuclease III [Balneolaceae bacterium]